MKKVYLFLIFTFLVSFEICAQIPQGFNYQAVVRDNAGDILANSPAELIFSILSNNINGPIVYKETHSTTTNNYGLINVVIGKGSPALGQFNTIEWTAGDHFLSVIINRTEVGVTQLLSVPYALVAGSTASREHIITIPSTTFIPNNNYAYYSNAIGQGGSQLTNPGNEVSNKLIAPVILPHGAIITEMTAHYKDNSTADLMIYLSVEFLSKGYFNPNILIITTSGASNEWKSATKQFNYSIDNNTNGYFLNVYCSNWSATGEKAIKGVTIKYMY